MTSTAILTHTENAPTVISLAGSAALVRDYLYYSLNSILYQRQLLDHDGFDKSKKYGLGLMVCREEGFQSWARELFPHLEKWMCDGKLQRVIVAVYKDADEVTERWEFHVNNTDSNRPLEDSSLSDKDVVPAMKKKSVSEIKMEMGRVLQQISIANSFLPRIREGSKFKVITFCSPDVEVNVDGKGSEVSGATWWHDGSPMRVKGEGGQRLRLGQVDTTKHTVNCEVEYKVREWEWD